LKKLNLMWIALSAAMLIFSYSCSKAPHLRPGYVPPEEIVEKFHDALQWQDFDTARLMVSPNARKAFEEFSNKNENKLNVVEYKIVNMEMKDDGYTVKVKVRRNFFVYPSVTSQEVEFIQTWELVGGRWLLSGPPF